MTSIHHNEIIQDTLKTIEEMNLLNRSDDEEISMEMGEQQIEQKPTVTEEEEQQSVLEYDLSSSDEERNHHIDSSPE